MKIEKFNLQHIGWLQIIEWKSSLKFFLLQNSLSCEDKKRIDNEWIFFYQNGSVHSFYMNFSNLLLGDLMRNINSQRMRRHDILVKEAWNAIIAFVGLLVDIL